MTPLCTSGYQGQDAAAWSARLLAHGIEVVVDVRDLPLSRKKGFSKSQLKALLGERGIKYLHVKELGNPKVYRDALRQGLDFEEFARIFRRRLETKATTLEELSDLAASRRVCLLCYEEDPTTCHRSLVAESVACRRPDAIEVVHL
ncbi:MAG: DUF488 domain-containing protein [Thermoleophilia bacterium]|nr:DUF488 domain-containing protein [Thermoleophilia bacterium]